MRRDVRRRWEHALRLRRGADVDYYERMRRLRGDELFSWMIVAYDGWTFKAAYAAASVALDGLDVSQLP